MACRTRVLIAALLVAALSAAQPALSRERHYYRDRGEHRHGGDRGAAIIGGLIGLGLGAAIIGSMQQAPPAYYAPPPAYYPPPGGYPPPPPTVYYGAPYGY